MGALGDHLFFTNGAWLCHELWSVSAGYISSRFCSGVLACLNFSRARHQSGKLHAACFHGCHDFDLALRNLKPSGKKEPVLSGSRQSPGYSIAGAAGPQQKHVSPTRPRGRSIQTIATTFLEDELQAVGEASRRVLDSVESLGRLPKGSSSTRRSLNAHPPTYVYPVLNRKPVRNFQGEARARTEERAL